MVSQGYDGASVMSAWCISGVQQRIRELVPQACYIHCYAHCLNLVLVDCAKSIAHASEFLSLLQSLYIFISSSKKPRLAPKATNKRAGKALWYVNLFFWMLSVLYLIPFY